MKDSNELTFKVCDKTLKCRKKKKWKAPISTALIVMPQLHLYIITAVSLIMGLFHISIDNYADGIALLIAAALYLACSIWVKKKPLIGIVTAFTLWLIFQLSVVLIDPVLLFKGIILKILVFSMFVKGIVSAKDAQSYSTQLKDLKAL